MARGVVRFVERHMTAVVTGLLLLALGLGLREALLPGDRLMGWDGADYDTLGMNLLAGRGLVHEGAGSVRGETIEFRLTGHRPPVYPAFLAVVYRLCGHSFRAVYVVQALLYCLTGYILFRLARSCFGGEGPALLTLLLYAFYLPLQALVRQVSTEILFTLFLVLQVFFLVRWVRHGGAASLVLSALSVAAATLTRPSSFLLPVFMFVFFAGVPAFGRVRRLRAFAVYVLIYALAISPWMVRQAVRFHEFVPVTTGGGITFWEGTGPAEGRTVAGWAMPGVPDDTVGEFRDLYAVGPDGWSRELALDKLARKKGLEIVRRDPGRYLRLTLLKVPKFWLGIDLESPSPWGTISPKRVAGLAMGFVVLAAALWGAVSVVRRRAAPFLAPAVVVAYFTAVHAFPYVLHRYGLPVHPFVLLFSVAGVLAVGARRDGADPRTRVRRSRATYEEDPTREAALAPPASLVGSGARHSSVDSG